MKLTPHVSLVASGNNGLCLTDGYDCNAYLIDSGDGLLLFDTGAGMDNAAIEREMRADGYDPRDIRVIVISHAHADHAAGAPYFQELSGARLVASRPETAVLHDAALLDDTMRDYIAVGFYPPGYVFPKLRIDDPLDDGDTLSLGALSLRAILAPGHTCGGLCLYGVIDGRETLLCGDTVFFGGKINLISIFDAELLAYKRSVLALERLPVEMLLPGHLQPLLHRGGEQLHKAAEPFRNYSVPPSLC